jgi:hypothetical protein
MQRKIMVENPEHTSQFLGPYNLLQFVTGADGVVFAFYENDELDGIVMVCKLHEMKLVPNDF